MNRNITNAKYKDTVFRLLFNNQKEALGLYNNLYKTNYTDETAVTLVTLEDVLFTPRKNDLAFLMNGNFLVLLEHQSTINENMPIRFLLYVARVYEKIMDAIKIYKQKRIPLPTPEFIVLYNGTQDLKKDGKKVSELELNLSDAFEKKSEFVSLELKVKVIDIRYSSQNPIVQKQDTLQEYSQFMDIVEKCRKQEKNLDTAMEQAIQLAISDGILKEFLQKHSSEVYNMLTLEYNEEIAQKVAREEAHEEGLKEGLKEGRKEGRERGLSVLVQTLKGFLSDPEQLYQTIIKNEEYKNSSREDVFKYL